MSFQMCTNLFILSLIVFAIQDAKINSTPLMVAEDGENNVYPTERYPNKFEKECVLLNEKYKNGYLYSASSTYKLELFWRSVYVWKPIFAGKRPNEFTDSDPQGVWFLLPVKNKVDTYYISNAKYGEYLYAIDMWKIDSALNNRRLVFTDKSDKLDNKDEKYMWEFRRKDNGMYEIWNVKFMERKCFK